MQIRPGDLRAGDILLLRSPGALSWATRLFDGAEVDRAALYLGDGRVAECVDGAPVSRKLEECLAGAELSLARRLKEVAPLEPVLGRAAEQLSSERAARPEVLLALLAASRKLRPAPSLRRVQRAALDAAAALLRGETPMTAAQFVWRCYEDALPEPSDVYTVRLNDLRNVEVVSGMLAEPGAGMARRLGRGVHPESLLAWAAQPLMRTRLMGAAAPEAMTDLEGALASYQNEVQGGTQSAPPTRAEGDALLGSLLRFAAAWSGTAPALAKSALPPKLELLFRYAADLCTAGDLMRSEDLFTV
jgi:hypothetical protein